MTGPQREPRRSSSPDQPRQHAPTLHTDNVVPGLASYLTITEAAARHNLPRQLIRQFIAQRKVRVLLTSGRTRVHAASLAEYLESITTSTEQAASRVPAHRRG